MTLLCNHKIFYPNNSRQPLEKIEIFVFFIKQVDFKFTFDTNEFVKASNRFYFEEWGYVSKIRFENTTITHL